MNTKSFALGVSTAAKDCLENTNLNSNSGIFLEFASEQIGKTVMLNSLDFPNLSISELARHLQSVIGTQFTTISYNQHNLDPKFWLTVTTMQEFPLKVWLVELSLQFPKN